VITKLGKATTTFQNWENQMQIMRFFLLGFQMDSKNFVDHCQRYCDILDKAME
jgi:hypothetical protein